MNTRTRGLLAVLLALLAALGGVVVIVDTDEPGKITVTIERPAPPATAVDTDGDGADDLVVPLTTAAKDTFEAVADPPPAVRESELDESLREPGDTPAGVPVGPLAADEIPGCRNRFVGNYSSRGGVRPQVIVWHQTVSRERGWSSQDGLTALANRRSSGVSWAALIGRSEGRCTYTVPLHLKSWTQGNANPFSVGIEVEAYGDEQTYVTGAGERKLLAVTRHIARRYSIPLRRGAVSNCRVVRSGIVEHEDLGACGGGHVDVASTTYQRTRKEIPGWNTNPLIAKLELRVTSVDKVTCRKLNAWRQAGRPRGGKWEQNSVRRRRALDTRGVTCTPAGPVRT